MGRGWALSAVDALLKLLRSEPLQQPVSLGDDMVSGLERTQNLHIVVYPQHSKNLTLCEFRAPGTP